MKLGLALGGGGAKGLVHIGILQTLTGAGIEFDVVAGTSIGAIVGVVYVSGNLDPLAEAAAALGLRELSRLCDPTWPTQGVFDGQNAVDFFSRFVSAEDIEDLPKPFAAVSVNIDTGEAESFTRGRVREAVRASMAIPGIFTPAFIDGRAYIDGGLVDPVPVAAAKLLGADAVVAVDLFGNNQSAELAGDNRTFSSLMSFFHQEDRDRDRKRNLNLVHILERTLQIAQQQVTQARLIEHPADVLIQPPVANIGPLDFHRAKAVIALGKDIGEAAVSQVLKLRALSNKHA